MADRDDRVARPAESETTRPRHVVTLAWLGFFLVSFDYTAASVALPSLARAFGVGTSAISWISLIYFMAIAGMLFPATARLRNLGYRRVLLTAFSVFAAASLGCAVSESLPMLLAFRAFQGMAAAVLYVAGPMLVRELLPADRQPRAFAILASAGPVGVSAGPALGGLVINFAGGQAVFLANIPLALWALWLVARHRPFGRRPAIARQRPNLSGLAFMAICSTALVLALNQGAERGWGSPLILSLLALAALALAALIFEERRARRPLIDRSLYSNAAFRMGNLVFFFALIPFGGLMVLLPFYLEWYHGYSAHGVGLMLTVQAVASVTASFAIGWLPSAVPVRARALAGVLVMLAGVLILVFLRHPGAPGLILGSLAMFGAGSGILMSTVVQVVMGSLPQTLTAVGSAVQSQVRTIAQMLGVVFLESIFSYVYAMPAKSEDGAAANPQEIATMLHGFHSAFWFGAGCLALALIAIAAMPARRAGGRET